MNTLGKVVGLGLLGLAVPAMAQEHGAQIVDQAWAEAMKANDLEAIVALYAPDAVAYFPDGDLQGIEAIRSYWAGFLAAFTVEDATNEGAYETLGDTSLGYGHWSMTAIPKAGGEPLQMQGRATVVVKKVGGRWQYQVDHASVPLAPPPEN